MSGTRPCKGCKQAFSAYVEKCPHCGRDDAHGSQLMGVIVLVGILMLLLPILAIAMLWF